MNENVKPMLYSLTTCLNCKTEKRFLEEHGIEFDCVNVDILQGDEREDALSEVMKITGKCRFPTIVIGDTVIVGFYEDKLTEALGL